MDISGANVPQVQEFWLLWHDGSPYRVKKEGLKQFGLESTFLVHPDFDFNHVD